MSKKRYLEIEAILNNQYEDKSVYVGSMKFQDLIKIVRFTNRKKTFADPLENKKSYSLESKDNYFQRDLNKAHIRKIIKFIMNNTKKIQSEKTPLFPTPIIISLDRNFDLEGSSSSLDFLESDSFYEEDSVVVKGDKIYIPDKKEIALVVDGQHRLKGIQTYIQETGDSEIMFLDLPVVFILGLDLYRLGEVFANINFEQRRVSKSLYYDIFGTLPTPITEIKFAHELALHLNNSIDSPLREKINMLGYGEGFFSQALFIDLVYRYFKLGNIWRAHYEDFFSGGRKDKEIARFMKYYFEAVKNNWSFAWRTTTKNEYKYILCKSTGIGALLRLIKDIYPLVKEKDERKIKTELNKIFSKIKNQEAKGLFSTEGRFGKSGSYGLQKELYLELKNKLLDK